MKNIHYKKEIVFWILMAIPFIYIGYIWNTLPETIVTHFDIHGNANGWGSKLTILLLPVISVFTYFLLLALPLIDPKRMNYESFSNTFYKVRLLLTVFLGAISLYITSVSVSGNMYDGGRWLMASIFLFITLMGNFMINIKPNWFIGIRTPWTLSSDTVWKKTHQLGGRTWFYGGMVCLLLTFLVKATWLYVVMFASIASSALFFVAYSFWLYKKEKKGTA